MSSLKISEIKHTILVWGKQHRTQPCIPSEDLLTLYSILTFYIYNGGQESNSKLLHKVLEQASMTEHSKQLIIKQSEPYTFIGLILLIKYNSSNKKEFIKSLKKYLNININDKEDLNYQQLTDLIISKYILATDLKNFYTKDYVDKIREISDTFA